MNEGDKEPGKTPEVQPDVIENERWELLEQMTELFERPMIFLSLVWLGIVVLDLTGHLPPAMTVVSHIIWGIFIVDFLARFAVAPSKPLFLKTNILTALSLLVPALRMFRITRALRAFRLARVGSSINLFRLVTSVNRSLKSVQRLVAHRGVGSVAAITLIVAIAGATGLYAFEKDHTDPGGGFFGWLWISGMLILTAGTPTAPVSVEGRILTLLLSLYGLAVLGYITAAVASYFIGADLQSERNEAPARMRAMEEELVRLRILLERLEGKEPGI